jgi:hypothetical protein
MPIIPKSQQFDSFCVPPATIHLFLSVDPISPKLGDKNIPWLFIRVVMRLFSEAHMVCAGEKNE